MGDGDQENKSGKWARQAKAARATQVAIDVSEQVHNYVQLASVNHKLKPSDYIRKSLGLPYKKSKLRPRLTFSLTEEDYASLAEKFGLEASDKIGIKHAVGQFLIERANAAQ